MHLVMNLSGAYEEQGFMPASSESLDLRGVEGTSCYCDPDAADAIRAAIAGFPASMVHWIDSGDYHYITLFWMERIEEPFALLLLDNHPDDQSCAFGDSILSCGSWVRHAREELPMLRHVCTVRRRSDPLDIPEGLPVYVSLDKDVMSRDFARTDWDQGDLTLEEVKARIAEAAASRRVIGVDVCGEIDASKGGCGEDVEINLKTNVELAEFLVTLRDKY